MNIQISHCKAANGYLTRVNRVKQLPAKLNAMEDRTAGGIIHKLKSVVESDYFKSLPDSKTIVSGVNNNYLWVKNDQLSEIKDLLNDVYV